MARRDKSGRGRNTALLAHALGWAYVILCMVGGGLLVTMIAFVYNIAALVVFMLGIIERSGALL